VSIVSQDSGSYRVLLCHVSGQVSPEAPVVFEQRESASRYVRMTGCPDCTGMPKTTVAVPHGFNAAVVIEHDQTCPAMRIALGKAGGRS